MRLGLCADREHLDCVPCGPTLDATLVMPTEHPMANIYLFFVDKFSIVRCVLCVWGPHQASIQDRF